MKRLSHILSKTLLALALLGSAPCAMAAAGAAPDGDNRSGGARMESFTGNNRGASPASRAESTTAASVTAGQGHIVCVAGSNDATFGIYSITGQLLRTVRVSAGNRTTIDLPRGFYIVKCGTQWSRKVVVK